MIGNYPKIAEWEQRRRATGFTKKDVLNNILSQELGRRQTAGTAPTFMGITKPRPPVATTTEALEQLRQFSREHQMDKRGSAFEGFNVSDRDYRTRRREFLVESEGSRSWVYKDHKGIRTVGIGFNMDKPGAEQEFRTALGVNKDTFDRVRDGELPLSSDSIRKLFDFSVQQAEGVVKDKFPDVALTNNQRLALVSLAFNNPSLIGPNLTEQVRSGDSKAATLEILHHSNQTQHKGLAKRRYREAMMFAGPANVDIGGSNPDASIAMPELPQYLSEVQGGTPQG